jgi:hypothetical protein
MIIEIRLNPDPQSIAAGQIVKLDHMPSWKVRKNPFSAKVTSSSSGDSVDALFAYDEDQNIEGEVVLWLPPGKSMEHTGIKVQFLGRIDLVRSRLFLSCCHSKHPIDS